MMRVETRNTIKVVSEQKKNSHRNFDAKNRRKELKIKEKSF